MKWLFWIGVVIAFIAHIIGFALNDYNITLKITGFIVAGSFCICATLSGVFFMGSSRLDERYLRNKLNESKEERDKKNKIVNSLILLALPSFIISIMILAFKLNH